MGFFTTSVTGLKTVVTAIGAVVGVWGVINLLEGYGMIIRVQMLMYGREAQSKTRIASPATIPKSGERNRKIHSCMLYLISI